MAIHPRLTFKTGTLSRFIQFHGIQADWREVPPTEPPTKYCWIRLFRPDGRTMEFWGRMLGPGGPSVEKALEYPAAIAYDWELAEGTPSGLARLFGWDETKMPGDVYAMYEEMALELHDFLGSRPYMDLMVLVGESQEEA